MRSITLIFIGLWALSPLGLLAAEEELSDIPYEPVEDLSPEAPVSTKGRAMEPLVEYFSAHSLKEGQWKLGLDADYGFTDRFMLGTDLLALFVGAPNLQMKWKVFDSEEHVVALAFVIAHYNKKTALWGAYESHFEELDATLYRPALAYTRNFSDRLKIHTYWGVGFGDTHAKLTEKGKRALWESKYPNGDWETRQREVQEQEAAEGEESTSENQEEKASRNSISNRTLQLQTLTGMISNIFQITGEFVRDDTKAILVTTRAEQAELEELKSTGVRITIAQQWRFSQFEWRFGIGLQHQELTGTDLDGEEINDEGILPAADIDFSWRF